jgi:hypothetical protein
MTRPGEVLVKSSTGGRGSYWRVFINLLPNSVDAVVVHVLEMYVGH